MGDEQAVTGRQRPRTVTQRRAAGFTVWYLRAVTFINFLSAVWVSLGQDLRQHNTENYFTPYLLTAGFASGAFTLFLAITMRRRKRAAWILNLVLGGLFLLLLAFAMLFPEIRGYAQNWISLVLTAAFVAALLVGRREFYAKGDRANPKLASAVAVGGLLVASLLATLLVTATNRAHDDYRSSFLDRWRYGTMRLVSLAADDERFAGITTPGWANVCVNILSTLLLCAVLYAAFRSRRAVDPLSEEDEERLRALLARHGDHTTLFSRRSEK
jgi:lysyl-tRNA synthetase class 2